MIKDNS